MSDWLKRTTNFAAGINVGGGDTGWRRFPQPTLLMLRVDATTTSATATLPAGTTLWEEYIIPDPEAVPTAGTVDLDCGATSHISGGDATAPSKAAVATVETLTAGQTVTVTGASLDGGVYVGFLVTLPQWPTSESR